MAAEVTQQQQGFPLLFFSYAHSHREDYAEQQDADLWVRKFYGHLMTQIEQLIDLPIGQESLFVDRRIELGANWPRMLSENLAKCAVFVPLYTRNYFRDPNVGREWSIIRMRQDMHVAATASSPNIVMPILWEPVRPGDIPVWARDIEYTHDELGDAYREYGLEELIRVKDHEAAYHRAVRFLARRIVAVATAPEQLRQLREIPQFHTLPDEFAGHGTEPAEPGKVRIMALSLDEHSSMPPGRSSRWYGRTALEWTPYLDQGQGQNSPVVQQAGAVARERAYVPEIVELTGRSEELRAGSAPAAPTIVLVDPWVTLDSSRWALLEKLDRAAQDKSRIRIIVPWNARDPETAANAVALQRGLDSRLGRSRSHGHIPSRHGAPGPTDSGTFGLAVGGALRIAVGEYVRLTLPAVAYPSRPQLWGPTGMGEPLGFISAAGMSASGGSLPARSGSGSSGFDSSGSGSSVAGSGAPKLNDSEISGDLLPIRIYLADTDARFAVERALKEVAEAFGVDYVTEFPGTIGSWRREILARKKKGAGRSEQLAKLPQAVDAQLLLGNQAQFDSSQAISVSTLIAALGQTSQAIIQIGPVFLVKVDKTVLVRELTQQELAFFRRNPALFVDPVNAMRYLQQADSRKRPAAR
jgi:FxsC-like protein